MATDDFSGKVFPICIGIGSSGGPAWRTTVQETTSGYENRNQQWSQPRRRFDAAPGIQKNLDKEGELIAFFHEHRGRLISFLFKDPTDNHAENENLGVLTIDPDGTFDMTGSFFKQYGEDPNIYKRTINYVSADNFTISIGADLDEHITDTDLITNDETNITTWRLRGAIPVGDIPDDPVQILATFDFFIKARFDTDILNQELRNVPDARRYVSVPIVEVR